MIINSAHLYGTCMACHPQFSTARCLLLTIASTTF